MKAFIPTGHRWSFSTVGGIKRVNLEKGSDLQHLGELDQKLWTALSCPVNGLEMDTRTLQLIDTDSDGKIRVPEVLAAVQWMCEVLVNPGDLLKQSAALPLSAINQQTEAGQKLHASAQTILKYLGKAEVEVLMPEDTTDSVRIFENTLFNGDGIITEASCGEQPNLLPLFGEIIACVGGITDRSGKIGINQALLDGFYEAVNARLAWLEAGKAAEVQALGAQTTDAWDLYGELAPKIADYFMRCKLAAYDEETTKPLNLNPARLEPLNQESLVTHAAEIAAYPLAKVQASGVLPLNEGYNPAWQKSIEKLQQLLVQPLLGKKQALSEQDWLQIAEKLEPFGAWLAAESGQLVSSLTDDRLQALAAGTQKAAFEALIAQDNAQQSAAENIMQVDQLVRYHRDLFCLLKNFVTFYDFYDPDAEPAIFQSGTLYLDQRSLSLCVRVNDMARHNQLAGMSGIYLIYCQCKARHSAEVITIVAALTNGDVDNLVVGRNALFYDNAGNDWDATIIKIIENPISIRQAFWTPYRRVAALIEKQINKFAAEQDKKVEADAAKTIEETNLTAPEAAPAPAVPFDIGKFVGIFAAISLALGAIGTALAAVVGGFLGLAWWKMPLAIAGLLLVISGPSMILAYLKLRKRNLAPLLDANGWAINARATINIQFGRTLTLLATLPAGASVSLIDPFAAKRRPYLKYVLFLSLLAGVAVYSLWRMGVLRWPF